ncbi:hypothetical protein [uncultured Gammaproteobacteria bacterium]|nr:hypothetical protein [uncultured Gammaproteobacteria bacterium]
MLDAINYSPPHRWLRNEYLPADGSLDHSPPHRWLRNSIFVKILSSLDSPPHRWLRKHYHAILFGFDLFTTTQVA